MVFVPTAIGKSTLAKMLLRLLDFDGGELLVNGTDIRRFDPREYHRHISAVMQDFSRYNFTLAENVGFGYVEKMACHKSVKSAVHLAEADAIVDGLPFGMDTPLGDSCFESVPWNPMGSASQNRHGLSGGEVGFLFCPSVRDAMAEMYTSGNASRLHALSCVLRNLRWTFLSLMRWYVPL
jgi:ABC-type multidrug transport system fused ATPase/permease subunit